MCTTYFGIEAFLREREREREREEMESVAVDANETFAVTRPSTSVTECQEVLSMWLLLLFELVIFLLNTSKE